MEPSKDMILLKECYAKLKRGGAFTGRTAEEVLAAQEPAVEHTNDDVRRMRETLNSLVELDRVTRHGGPNAKPQTFSFVQSSSLGASAARGGEPLGGAAIDAATAQLTPASSLSQAQRGASEPLQLDAGALAAAVGPAAAAVVNAAVGDSAKHAFCGAAQLANVRALLNAAQTSMSALELQLSSWPEGTLIHGSGDAPAQVVPTSEEVEPAVPLEAQLKHVPAAEQANAEEEDVPNDEAQPSAMLSAATFAEQIKAQLSSGAACLRIAGLEEFEQVEELFDLLRSEAHHVTVLDLRGGRITSDVALIVCQCAADLFAQKPLRSLDMRGVYFGSDDELCADLLHEALEGKDIELLL